MASFTVKERRIDLGRNTLTYPVTLNTGQSERKMKGYTKMDTEKQGENYYLNENAIEIFIKANILHSIDRDLLKVKWEDVSLSIKKMEVTFLISLCYNKKSEGGFVTQFEFKNSKTPEIALRRMMGVAMQVLDTLNHHAHNEKVPVIKVVK